MNMNLQKQYDDWRNTGLEASQGTDIPFTWDCGEESARKDFSDWAELNKEISFEDMWDLEKNYSFEKPLKPEQIEKIENIFANYQGSERAVDHFWELYNESAYQAGDLPNEHVNIDTYIKYLEDIQKYNKEI